MRWANEAKKAAEQAIGDKAYKYPTPDIALETYAAVGTRIISSLNRSDSRQGLVEDLHYFALGQGGGTVCSPFLDLASIFFWNRIRFGIRSAAKAFSPSTERYRCFAAASTRLLRFFRHTTNPSTASGTRRTTAFTGRRTTT